MSAEIATVPQSVVAADAAEHHHAHKRTREEGEEGAEQQQQQQQLAASGSMAGRPVPPPLKFATSEVASPDTAAAIPVGPNAVASPLADPSRPNAIVRIKSRVGSAASPLSPPPPPAAAPAGLGSLKINSPPTTPAIATGLASLKINSPTGAAAGPSFSARIGSPTGTGATKSPTRYAAMASGPSFGAAASAAAGRAAGPEVRYCELLSRILLKDAGIDVEETKAVALNAAKALVLLPEPKRTDRVKTILHHLSDDKNLALRDEIRRGIVTGDQLATMDTTDLMNPEKRSELANKREWAEKDRNLQALEDAKRHSSAMYTCPKCKKSDCTFYEKQTRSADEPMTQFITCNVCKYKWKIC